MVLLVYLSIILITYLIYFVFKNNKINLLVSVSLVIYSIIWFLVPGIIFILLYHNVVTLKLPVFFIKSKFALYYFLESFVFIFSVAICYCINNKLDYKYKFAEFKTKKINIIYLIISFLIILLMIILNSDANYLNNNDLTINRPFYDTFLSILYGISKTIVIYVAVYNTENKRSLIFSWLCVVVVLYYELSLGSRISIFYPIFILLCYLRINRDRIGKKLSAFMLVMLLIVSFVPISQEISSQRAHSDRISITGDVVEGYKIERILQDFFGKFDSITSGMMLVEGYGVGVASYKPYIGSLFVFIPRFIYPNRPVATSIDGTVFGTPSRLVPQFFTKSQIHNVGVSPYSISVWQFGWFFGFMVITFFCLLNYLILNYYLTSNVIIFNILALNSMKIPSFLGLYYSGDSLLRNIVQLIICVIIYRLISRLLSLK